MTLTLIARNPYTRQIGVAMASGSDDCAGGSLYTHDDLGLVSVQGKGDRATGEYALDLMSQRVDAADIITALRARDMLMDMRQVIVAPFDGDMAVFTGKQCLHWAGHIGHEHHVLAGNMLASDKTLAAMEKSYLADPHVPLRRRLRAALEAGVTTGGDVRGHRSAAVLVLGYQPFSCRVTASAQPLQDLAAQV